MANNFNVKNNTGPRSTFGVYLLTRTFMLHADEEKDFVGCNEAVNKTVPRPNACER